MKIINLPPELLAHIFQFLDVSSAFQFRAVCKIIERASLPVFARRFFKKKGFLVTTSSLNILTNISNHPKLRNYVQHVWINPDCWTFAIPDYAPSDWDGDQHEIESSLLVHRDDEDMEDGIEQDPRFLRYVAVSDDHDTLLYTSALEDRLAEIFARLPNLEILGMRRSTDHNPWGWKRLRDMIDQDPRVLGPIPRGPADTLSGPTRLFIALVKAVARSGTRLKRMYTDAIELDNINRLSVSPAELNAACGQLQWLEVNVTKAWLLHEGQGCIALDKGFEQRYGARLAELLKSTPRLKGLDLMIFPDRQQRHLVPPVHNLSESWRESYPYLALQRVASSIELQFLQRLKLEKITTCTKTLLNLLRPCKDTLKSLKLREIRLLSSSPGEGRAWQTVFAFLSNLCPKMSYILLHQIKHATGVVAFAKLDPSIPPQMTEVDALTITEFGGPAAGEVFTSLEHISLEVEGREAVRQKLAELVESHWYEGSMFSYMLSDVLWFTDTSDEE